MEYRIKRGTNNKPALRRRYENAAFAFVREILSNNRKEFQYFLNNRGQNYTLKNQGVLKGFAILGHNKANGTVVLGLIGTSAEAGKGYGTALMKRIRNNARNRGVPMVVIHDPVGPARGFYKKFGATSAVKARSNATSLMHLPTGVKRKRSPSPTSRRQATPNRQRSPSRPSPKRHASVRSVSQRLNAIRQTPRR